MLIENGRMDRKAEVKTLYIVQFASGHIIILLFAEKNIYIFFLMTHHICYRSVFTFSH